MSTERIASAFQTAEPVNRATFHALLTAAVDVAQPGSGPVLALLQLDELREIGERHGPERQQAMADAAARRLAAAVGTEGFVSVIGPSRLAVLAASDGQMPSAAMETTLISSLLRPTDMNSARLPVTISLARWPSDGVTADALFVAVDHAIHTIQADIETMNAPQPGLRFVAFPLSSNG